MLFREQKQNILGVNERKNSRHMGNRSIYEKVPNDSVDGHGVVCL